jgi:carbamate kinase
VRIVAALGGNALLERGEPPEAGIQEARELDADALLLLTDVAAVQDGYGTPQARPIRRATPEELRKRDFPAGSMGPKIEAVCRFTEATGRPAAIGRLADAEALLSGRAGTLICSPGPRAAARAALV